MRSFSPKPRVSLQKLHTTTSTVHNRMNMSAIRPRNAAAPTRHAFWNSSPHLRDRIIQSMCQHNGTEPDLIETEDCFTVRLWKERKDA